MRSRDHRGLDRAFDAHYGAVGGHSYGWVYVGPMGSVLTPLMTGLDASRSLPNACTLNGRCASVCPVKIPLPDLLRKHRIRRRSYARQSVGNHCSGLVS